MSDSFVSYLRVSTDRQGRSGLGIEAQRAAVASYLSGFGAVPVAEFVEVESGKRADRPELARALTECRVRQATLVIAKLDRLARDAHLLLGLQRSGIAFTAADMPNANRLTAGIMAMVAEEERRANLGTHESRALRCEGAWGQTRWSRREPEEHGSGAPKSERGTPGKSRCARERPGPRNRSDPSRRDHQRYRHRKGAERTRNSRASRRQMAGGPSPALGTDQAMIRGKSSILTLAAVG